MQARNILDPLDILATLGIHAPQAVERVTGGMTTMIWRVEHAQHTYALRVFTPMLARRFEDELKAMEHARAGNIPVPEVYATGMYEDHPVMLLQWCQGRPLAQALQAQPWRAWSWGKQFGQMQAAMHAVAYPADDEAEDWISWAGPREDAMHARLRALQPRHQLLHLDYHLLNVLVDDHHITAVLDWTNARSGDPRADLARTFTILNVEPLPRSLLKPLIRCVLWIFTRGWRYGYRRRSEELDEMALFYAWAGAVMFRDLAPRVDRADSWWQSYHLEAIRRWTIAWKRRAELPIEPCG
jgi:aminoglycoside phosphotransferase (APT) family kinase protein